MRSSSASPIPVQAAEDATRRAPNRPPDTEKDEGRRHGEQEVEVREEAERVQDDDAECGKRERDERSPPSRTSERDPDHAHDDPHPRPREPPGELVEAKTELRVPRSIGEPVEERRGLALDLLEARTIAWIVELEVPFGRGGPHLPDALVGS